MPLAGHAGGLDEEDLAAGRASRPARWPRRAMPVRSASSRKNRDGPSSSATRSGSIVVGLRWPSARRRATLRQIAAISRSRLRRPASRV